jgi:hypothetical protein
VLINDKKLLAMLKILKPYCAENEDVKPHKVCGNVHHMQQIIVVVQHGRSATVRTRVNLMPNHHISK